MIIVRPHRVLILSGDREVQRALKTVLEDRSPEELYVDLSEDLPLEAPAKEHASFETSSYSELGDATLALERGRSAGRPFSVALVDLALAQERARQVISVLLKHDPALQIIVLNTSLEIPWRSLLGGFAAHDGLLMLRYPCEAMEVVQAARALANKWQFAQERAAREAELEAAVSARTMELERSKQALLTVLIERDRMEAELRLAQKLEAVGQLAAGIAHEINTPIQFVSDTVHFLRSGTTDLRQLLALLEELAPELTTNPRVLELKEEIDLELLDTEMPKSFERITEGLGRVRVIVRAMKDFAHPRQDEMSDADLNQAIMNTLVVSRNEYKYVADAVTDLGEIPPVKCHVGDLNQVFLNLIVNAAHAIESAHRPSEQRPKITIRTQRDGSQVVVTVADEGTGIPEEIRGRIFDHFFTTKEVGRGTGQGLAIARAIVERHGGAISFETEVGRGTSFVVRLPIDPTHASAVAA